MFNNPYTPGAGCIPAHLAGREELVEIVRAAMRGLVGGHPQRPIVLYGLRGVGKTVLLNVFEEIADQMDIRSHHLEATDSKMLTGRLLGAVHSFLNSMSIKERASDIATKTRGLIRSFALTYDVKEITLSLEPINDKDSSIGIFSDDLTNILVHLGKVAKASENSICLFIDEAQYLTKEQVVGIVMAMHRCNQLRLPLMVICAGLPKVLQTFSKECSYAERLFRYEMIGKLDAVQSEAAIRIPAKQEGVQYTDNAVRKIIEQTEGYPYFIQEFCSCIWESLPSGTRLISEANVDDAAQKYISLLDNGFYSSRYARCNTKEKSFMLVMAQCKDFPCVFSEVANLAGYDSVQSASPIRATLISKGMVYSPERGKLDFTVPKFADYLKRCTDP